MACTLAIHGLKPMLNLVTMVRSRSLGTINEFPPAPAYTGALSRGLLLMAPSLPCPTFTWLRQFGYNMMT